MPSLRIGNSTVSSRPVPEKGDVYYWDTELRGFGLRVTPKGVRSYVVQYRLKGAAARRVTLGVHGSPWTPARARERAQEMLLLVKQGIDPAEAERRKARERQTLNFSDYLDHFRDACLKEEWKDSWQGAYRTLEMHAKPALGSKALPQIDADDIADLMNGLRSQKALARKVWAVLSRLFSFAVEERKIPLTANPMKVLRAPKKPDDRKRVLTPDEIIAAWRASYELPHPFGPFIRLLFCTLQRRNEVAGMPWDELDQERAVWIIDADRAKNDEDHLLPLNELALAELEALGWKRRGFVLTTTGRTPISGFSKAKAALDKAMLPILQDMANKRAEALGGEPEAVELKRWTFHDLRRTGSTMLQALGVPIEVADRLLNHKGEESATGSRRAYFVWKYEPEKREASHKWGHHLQRLCSGNDENVALLRAARHLREDPLRKSYDHA